MSDFGPAGGCDGFFFGSASIGVRGGFDSAVGSASAFGGFGVTVGGGATGPSGTARRESLEDTTFLGIAMSGSTSASTGIGGAGGAGSTGGSSATTGAGSSGAAGTGSAATTGSGSGSGAGAAAFFFAGGFFVETTGLASAGGASSLDLSSSSTGVSRISPSRLALQRTR